MEFDRQLASPENPLIQPVNNGRDHNRSIGAIGLLDEKVVINEDQNPLERENARLEPGVEDETVSKVASEIGLTAEELEDDTDEDDSPGGFLGGTKYIDGDLQSWDSARRTKPSKEQRRVSVQPRTLTIDFRHDGVRFDRPVLHPDSFGQFDEDLRILIAYGLASNAQKYDYLQGDPKRRADFVVTLANKGAVKDRSLDLGQLRYKVRRLQIQGLLAGRGLNSQLTDAGFAKVVAETPKIRADGRIVRPKKRAASKITAEDAPTDGAFVEDAAIQV